MNTCMTCQKQLTNIDIGATKKFINRGATSYYCKSCLAARLKVSEALIDQKIEHFKKQGCTLFL